VFLVGALPFALVHCNHHCWALVFSFRFDKFRCVQSTPGRVVLAATAPLDLSWRYLCGCCLGCELAARHDMLLAAQTLARQSWSYDLMVWMADRWLAWKRSY
jgi:hypothetical protein